MKDEEIIVATLAALKDEWNTISKQMAWNNRKGKEDVPPLLRALVGVQSMTRIEWNRLREQVLKYRRSAVYRKKKEAAEKKKVARRDYMRGYMRRYRTENDT